MAALFSFLVTLVLSVLVVRVATVALTMTGISRDIARFQALSAFSGVGFTTNEAETIINHPLRRRIIAVVIRLGNLGLITTISSLVLTFAGPQSEGQEITRLFILSVSLVVLGLLALSRPLDRLLTRVFRRVLSQRSEFDLTLYDYESLLNLTNGYSVGEVSVDEDSWVAKKSLREASLPQEGIIVLGIQRDDGTYVGAPQAETRICVGDRLLLYGLDEDIADLNDRLANPAGDADREQAVRDQEERVREQDRQDTYSYSQ
jgi:hypothetical protein